MKPAGKRYLPTDWKQSILLAGVAGLLLPTTGLLAQSAVAKTASKSSSVAAQIDKSADKTAPQDPAKDKDTGSATTDDKIAPATDEEKAEGKKRLMATIKAHGGDAFLKAKTIEMKGKGEVTPPNQEADTKLPIEALTITFAAPDKTRLELTANFGAIVFGAPGGDAKPWLQVLGQTRDAPAGLSSINPNQALLLAAQNEKDYSVRSLPEEMKDGKEVKTNDGKALTGFAITDKTGAVTRLYAEKESGLLRRLVVFKGADNDIQILLGDYHKTENVQLPGMLKLIRGKTALLDLTFDKFAVNKPVDDSIFGSPK